MARSQHREPPSVGVGPARACAAAALLLFRSPGLAARVTGIATRAVHAGERPDASGAVNTPIVQSTTYRYPEKADGTPAQHIYSRYDNPTVQALEAKVEALEGAPAWAFSSGMGAISTLCQTVLRPGDTVAVMDGVYGGTTAYMGRELAAAGVQVARFDAFGGQLPEAKLVWMESITNPLLRVPDLPAWAERIHDAGALLAVDATFATPILQRPLEWADFVVHSATKYLGGHSDVTAGVLAAKEHVQALWETRRNLGATLDPHAAYLVQRGMKTLPLRVRAQSRTAAGLAAALVDHPGVHRVHYPGLPGHPDQETASRLLHGGFGGMLTLDLGSLDAAIAFRRRVRLITPAASLGGVESLVSLPVETSHAYASADDRRREGVTDGLVRLSIGLEDEEDLLADVRGALGQGR